MRKRCRGFCFCHHQDSWFQPFKFKQRPKITLPETNSSINPVWLDCHLCGMLRRLYSSCDSGQSWHEITDQVDVGARCILCIFPIRSRVNIRHIFCFMLLLKCELVVFDFQFRKVNERCCRSPWYFGRVPGQHQDLSNKNSLGMSWDWRLFVLSNHSNRLLFHTSISEWTVVSQKSSIVYSLEIHESHSREKSQTQIEIRYEEVQQFSTSETTDVEIHSW